MAKTPRPVTFIARNGSSVHVPDMSGDNVREKLREAGLGRMVDENSTEGLSLGDLMAGFQRFEDLMGVTRMTQPPAGGIADFLIPTAGLRQRDQHVPPATTDAAVDDLYDPNDLPDFS